METQMSQALVDEKKPTNGNGNLLKTLTTSETYQDYQRAFTEATGMPVALRPLEAWQLPLHRKAKENRFCALMAANSRTCAACLQMQERLSESAKDKPATLTCGHGLCETAVPVKLGNQTIGLLQTGQVFTEKPSAQKVDRVLKQLRQDGVPVDPNEAKDAYMQTTVVTAKKLEAMTKLLAIFAEQLSAKSNQITVQQKNAEPPVIAKAKQYIMEHSSEELSLDQVAKAVNTSRFYFCKLFKQAANINFTEFVSRVRLEKARNLLLNPNLRVSEIAFEVGFQSLTHFNRVFKKFVGKSPTEYRQHLPVA